MRYALLPVLVLVSMTAAAKPENLLKNPGFEDEVNTAWVANGKPKATIEAQIDDKVFKSGKRSYRTGEKNFLQMIPVREGRRYRVRAFIKSEEMQGDGAHITVGAKDAGKKWVKGLWARTESLKGSIDWKEYVRDGIAFPKGTAYAWVALYGPQDKKDEEAGGVAWFDDMCFEDVTLEPLAKAMEGKSYDEYRKSVKARIDKPESASIKAKAKRLFDELEPFLAKNPDELTSQEVDAAVQLVEAIGRLKSQAKIEELLTE